MTRRFALAAAVVTVVVLAAVGVVILDGVASSGSRDVAPQHAENGTAANDSALGGDDERVEVELTAYDGGTQLHTYENVSGTTTFTVSKAGRSPDRWFVSGIGVGQGDDYAAALNPYYSRGRTGESSCESPGA